MSIPAGIDSQQRIVLRGQGSAGRNGGVNGDLVIEVMVKPHEIFTRDGSDVYCDVPISFTEAALGAEIDIPMLGDKTEKYTIPEGTQSGSSFTLRGKGITNINTKRRGDMILTVVVETPKNLNQEQKKLLEELAASLGEKSTGKKRNKKWFK